MNVHATMLLLQYVSLRTRSQKSNKNQTDPSNIGDRLAAPEDGLLTQCRKNSGSMFSPATMNLCRLYLFGYRQTNLFDRLFPAVNRRIDSNEVRRIGAWCQVRVLELLKLRIRNSFDGA